MGRRRKRRSMRFHDLPYAQLFELWIGPDGKSAFESPWHRREAWEQVKDTAPTSDGQRSWGWWEYESGERRNYDERQHRQLFSMGELSPNEQRTLREWSADNPAFALTLDDEWRLRAEKALRQRWSAELWTAFAKDYGVPAELVHTVAEQLRELSKLPRPEPEPPAEDEDGEEWGA